MLNHRWEKNPFINDFLHTGANELKNYKDPSISELAKIINNNEIEVVISSLILRGDGLSRKV